MNVGDKLVIWLVCNYIVILIAYIYGKDYFRALYWFGAIVIVLSTLGIGRG